MAGPLDVVYVSYMQTTPDKAWQAITDPESSARYWAHSNVSEWRAGSRWEHRRVDGSGIADIVGTVVEVEPPLHLVLTWANPADSTPVAGPEVERDGRERLAPSRVTVDIEPFAQIVRFTVVHENLASEAERAGLAAGWSAVVSNLKTFLETGHPLPQPPWEMLPGFVRE